MVSKSVLGAVCACSIAMSISTAANAGVVRGQGTWETTLEGRDLDGNPATLEAYYDTVLNITWLADANYALTSGYPNGGRMSWVDANAWAAGLDISGVTGWRLPNIVDIGNDGCNWSVSGGTDCGYNVDTTTSELAHMFYNVLGNLAYFDTDGNSNQPNWGLTNTGPFIPGGNVEPGIYWSATDSITIADAAWGFEMSGGRQDVYDDYRSNFSWAVHDGDVGEATTTLLILIPWGTPQECTGDDGRNISMDAHTTVVNTDAIDTVTWTLDGSPVASGESVNILVPLGAHTVEATVTTILLHSATDSRVISVDDTTAPVISAAFINKKTGAEITTIKSKDKADISYSVNDACDANPTFNATAGIPAENGDTITAKTSKKDSSVTVSVQGNANTTELAVTAEDASGNMSSSKAVLTITP